MFINDSPVSHKSVSEIFECSRTKASQMLSMLHWGPTKSEGHGCLCVCVVMCTHAFLNTLHPHTTSHPLLSAPHCLSDLEARLSPPLLWHFKRRERFRVTVRKIHLGDISEWGSPSLPARYLPRLAGDEGGSHCSWLHFTVVAVWFLCRCCRYTHLELERQRETTVELRQLKRHKNMHFTSTSILRFRDYILDGSISINLEQREGNRKWAGRRCSTTTKSKH